MRDKEKKTEPRKDENKAEAGLGKEQGGGKRETLGRQKGGTDASGRDRTVSSGNTALQTRLLHISQVVRISSFGISNFLLFKILKIK